MTLNKNFILMLVLSFLLFSTAIVMSLQQSGVVISSFGVIRLPSDRYVCGNLNSTHYYVKNLLTDKYEFMSVDAVESINYALDHLSSGRTWKEKIFLIGNFFLNTYIRIYSYTILEFKGTIQTSSTTTSLIRVIGSAGYHAQHIEIHGGSVILPSGTNRPAIWLSYADDVLIEGVEAKGAGAIKLENCNRITIMNCSLIGIEPCAILLMDSCNGVEVFSNYISGTVGKTGFQGILTQGPSGCAHILIQNNEITRFGGELGAHGIYVGVAATHDIKIIGNDFHDALPNSGNAIRFDGTGGFISQCMFHDLLTAYSCAFVGTTKTTTIVYNVTIVGNTVNRAVRGFYLYARNNDTIECSVLSNTINNCTDFGVLLLGEQGHYVRECSVNNNFIRNCTNYGIYLYTGTMNNTVAGNYVTGCGINILDKGIGNHVYNNTSS